LNWKLWGNVHFTVRPFGHSYLRTPENESLLFAMLSPNTRRRVLPPANVAGQVVAVNPEAEDIVPRGTPIAVLYVMESRVFGRTGDNVGLAAINDPFFLETDPVQVGSPMNVTFTTAPEPQTAILGAIGLPAYLLTVRKLMGCSGADRHG
jgi:hypothetical protein